MSIPLLIISIVFFIASIVMIFVREMLSPVAAFLGLLFMWLSDALPLNSTIVIMWLCMAVLVTCIPMLQDMSLRNSRHGLGYMTSGAFVGLAVGLLGVSFVTSAPMLYGVMIVAVAVGVFFGFMLYTNTPDGKSRNIAFRRSFSYLLAKGFPIAITVMQIGIVLVLLILVNQIK